MEQITTIGIDLAKSVFQVHAVDAYWGRDCSQGPAAADFLGFAGQGAAVPGLACCPSSHHWGRELVKLGHDVRLIPPAYVKPYVRRQKNDAADAAAICEAVSRPSMRFVTIKTEEQQAALMLHRARALLISQRTALICAIRGHLAELGLVAPRGRREMKPRCWRSWPTASDDSLPPLARAGAAASGAPSGRASRPSWSNSTTNFLAGIAPVPPACAWRPSQASGRSRLRRSSPASPIRRFSSPGGSSPPSSGSCPVSRPAEARSAWGGSPRWAIDTFAASWSREPRPCCDTPRSGAPHLGTGRRRCSGRSRSSSLPWRWPTRPRVSLGRS